MSPHGAVIWLLACATLAVPGAVAWLLSGRRRNRAVLITDAKPPQPARPELDEYTDGTPAPGAAWAVGSAPEDDEGR